MELRRISTIKANFGEQAFENSQLLSKHKFNPHLLAIYEIFRELLKESFTDDEILGELGSELLNDHNICTFNYTFKKKDRKITVKVVLVENEQKLSVNCLDKAKDETLLSCDVPIDGNPSIDKFIKDATTEISEKIINKLSELKKQQQNQERDTQPVRLQPVFVTQPHYHRPQPVISPYGIRPGVYGPHIRIDPVFPPDIGGINPPFQNRPDSGDFPEHPDLDIFTGNQMGPNHPMWRRGARPNPQGNFPPGNFGNDPFGGRFNH